MPPSPQYNDVVSESPLPYQAMIEQMTDAVIYADSTGIIRAWNHGSEVLFGFTSDEAVGQSLDIIIPEHLREAHWRGFNAAMASGVTKHGGKPTRTRATNKAGDRIYAEVSFSVVEDSASDTRGSVAVARAAEPPPPRPSTPA